MWYDRFSVKGKRVFLTGAAGGIGIALTRAFLDAGAMVFAVTRRESTNWEGLDSEYNGLFFSIICNLSREDDILRAINTVEEKGGVDVLVNNASTTDKNKMLSYQVETIRKTFQVNFEAAFLLCAAIAPQMAARGIALLFTNGQNIPQLGRYTVFGQGSIGPVPISILFIVVITIVIWYILRHTSLGRSLYAIGGNEEAAIASGISVNRNKYIVFIINGVLVGIAGVLFMSRVNAGLPNGAVGYEMEGLTAAIVGGTSFSGGVGTTMGTFAGALIIGCLNNIMNLTGVNSYVQQIVKGTIIALAVIWDIYSKNKKTTKVILVENEKEKEWNEEKSSGSIA